MSGGRPATTWIVRSAIALTIVAAALWIHLFEFQWGLAFDSHVFLLIGKGIHYGLLPYRDLFDHKPPGIYYYFAAVFSVLPMALWSIRIVDFLVYLCGAAAFYALCKEGDVGRPIALLGTVVWLYLSHHPFYNFNGLHTEEYMAIFEVCTVAAAARYHLSRWPPSAVLSGLAASGAVLFKHPGAVVVVPALILIADRSGRKIVPLFLLTFIVPLLLTLGYFWYAGGLTPFIEANFWSVIGSTTVLRGTLATRVTVFLQQMGGLLRDLPGIAVGLALGVAACLTRPTRFRVAAIVWVVVDTLAVGAEGRYFRHHFIQMFPAMTLVATMGAAWLLQPRRAESRYRVALRLAVAAGLVFVSWPAIHAIYSFRQSTVAHAWKVLLAGPRAWPTQTVGTAEDRMARYIHERTRPVDRIHVAGWGGGLPGIYWAADRFPASRHFFPVLGLPPSPERQRELLADLERNPPLYVLLLPQPVFFRDVAPLLAERYTIEKVFYDQYEIWVRNRVEPFTSGAAVNLSADARTGGLVIQPPAESERGRAHRSGRWTSPVTPVDSDDGTILIDWNVRTDVARNSIGTGFPQANIGATPATGDPRRLLGFLSEMPPDNRTDLSPADVTVDIGFRAMVNRIGVTTDADARGANEANGCCAIETTDAVGADAFTPLRADWTKGTDRDWEYAFEPTAVDAARVHVMADGPPARRAGLRRVRILSTGMGIAVRYRSGATAELDDAPWVTIESPAPHEQTPRMQWTRAHPAWQAADDPDAPVWVPVQRYVQVQCKLWSDYLTLTPVLRYAQIGGLRFASRDDARESAAH
jgi:hypothetical protein